MTKAIFIILFTLTCFVGCCQIVDNTGRHNEKNIYYQALASCIRFPLMGQKKIVDTIFIYKDNKTTDSLLEKIDSTVIIMVDNPYDYIKKHNRQTIVLYRIFPLDYSNNEFSVSFVPFVSHINRKTHMLYLENPGTLQVFFKFENNHFTYLRVEDHGI